MKVLEGRVAIVTGAGNGIGRAEAIALARAGAQVVVNDIATPGVGRTTAADVVDEIRAAGGEAIANTDSVADFAGAGRIVAAAKHAFGRLDILINNAGNYQPAFLDEMDEALFDRLIAVHLKGQWNTCRHAVPLMKAQRAGVIINTSSESGLGRAANVHYAAAKEGVVGLTRSLARELGRFNIRVNAIRPRAADTLMTAQAWGEGGQLQRFKPLNAALGRFSLGEMAHTVNMDAPPEQIALFAAWLASDAARNVNGRTFLVGGGLIVLYTEPQHHRTITPAEWTPEKIDALVSGHLTFDLENHFILSDSIGDREI